ncbi:MAG: hypothetical protein RIB61_06915 [Roseicyclus sp.]
MRVCVIVPTTDGPAPILRLTRLAQAPRSVMRTQDDYRPLPPSGRYHAFVQMGGALADRIGYGAGQFELRLGSVVETGRSWELPVAIAHWLQAQGHELGADAPDLLVWATGALDNDLRLLPQDYHLARKLDQSAACLKEALNHGARVVLVVPEAIALPPDLKCPGPEIQVVADLDGAVKLFEDRRHMQDLRAASQAGLSDRKPGWDRGVGLRVAVASVLIGLIVFFLFVVGVRGVDPREATTLRVAEAGSSDIDIADAEVAAVTSITSVPEAGSEAAGQGGDVSAGGQPQDIEGLPRLVVEYAPDGSNCQAVLFGSLAPERRDLVFRAGTYPDFGLTGLCSIGFSLPDVASTGVELALPHDLLDLVLPSDRRASLWLVPGDTQMLRLRATLPELLDTRIGLNSGGEEAGALSLTAVR